MARRQIKLLACAIAALAMALAALAPFTAQAARHATASDDRISGTKRADVISGRGGNDVLSGRAGNDRLKGGRGDDTLNGGTGRDRLDGGPGHDRLRGGAGADILNAGPGDDVIRARDGVRDRVVCGSGLDIAVLDSLDVATGCEAAIRPAAPPAPAKPATGPAPAPAGPAGPAGGPGPADPGADPDPGPDPDPGADPDPGPDPDPDPAPDPDPDPNPDPGPDPDPDPEPGPDPDPEPVVEHMLAAGDIADCTPGAESTAALLDTRPGTVAVLGDAAYPNGSYEDFANCYHPTWGRHLARTRPAIGNHEYNTERGAGYFSYFGDAAGDPLQGWYSYDLGSWHVVVLNTNCSGVGGCGTESPQGLWLRDDLEAHPSQCTLAYFHTPRFSSGEKHGNDLNTSQFWEVLYEHGAELVMGGNDHNYERFGPQTPAGVADPVNGIRQFVVGTGGRFLRPVSSVPEPNSEALDNTTFGILSLDLMDDSYAWEFVPATPGGFTDSGSTACH